MVGRSGNVGVQLGVPRDGAAHEVKDVGKRRTESVRTVSMGCIVETDNSRFVVVLGAEVKHQAQVGRRSKVAKGTLESDEVRLTRVVHELA